MTDDELKQTYAEQDARRKAACQFTIEKAVKAMGQQWGLNANATKTLLSQLMQAAQSHKLTVLDPHTDLPKTKGQIHEYYELVTPATVNAWLKTIPDESRRWNEADIKPQAAPDAPVDTAAQVAVAAPAGTATVWTPERKTEARAMLNKHRSDGVRDFARRTAKSFNVSAARLNMVLGEKTPKQSAKKASVWDV